MNLVTAAATGKPFKRKHEKNWRKPHHAQTFGADDLVATDYIIEEKPVSITPSQYWLAYREALNDSGFAGDFPHNLLKRLGL